MSTKTQHDLIKAIILISVATGIVGISLGAVAASSAPRVAFPPPMNQLTKMKLESILIESWKGSLCHTKVLKVPPGAVTVPTAAPVGGGYDNSA